MLAKGSTYLRQSSIIASVTPPDDTPPLQPNMPLTRASPSIIAKEHTYAKGLRKLSHNVSAVLRVVNCVMASKVREIRGTAMSKQASNFEFGIVSMLSFIRTIKQIIDGMEDITSPYGMLLPFVGPESSSIPTSWHASLPWQRRPETWNTPSPTCSNLLLTPRFPSISSKTWSKGSTPT
jgi:hypothetical protein